MGCSSPVTVTKQAPPYTPQVQIPAKPIAYDCTSSKASNPSTEVVLCWNLDPNVKYYLVRDNWGYGGGIYGSGANIGYRNTAHLTGLTPGVSVLAQVAGVNSAGQGLWSDVVTMHTQSASCPAGQYWNGSQCVPNPATQNIIAWDSTPYSTGLGAGCITPAWKDIPAGTTELQIWHINSAGYGDYPLATGIPPQANSYHSICGLTPGGGYHWNVRALQNGVLIGYSNVVLSEATGTYQ